MRERLGWYQDDAGDVSALRLIVVPSAVVGLSIAVAGAVAMFLDLPAAGTAMATGAGMVAATGAAKAWQKASEVQSAQDVGEGVGCG